MILWQWHCNIIRHGCSLGKEVELRGKGKQLGIKKSVWKCRESLLYSVEVPPVSKSLTDNELRQIRRWDIQQRKKGGGGGEKDGERNSGKESRVGDFALHSEEMDE